MPPMRDLIGGLAILFFALVFAVLPVVATGKGFFVMFAAGHPAAAARWTTLAAALAAGFVAVWAALGVAAHRYPRKYYQLQSSRRYALWIGLGCLVYAAGSALWRQALYGAAL